MTKGARWFRHWAALAALAMLPACAGAGLDSNPASSAVHGYDFSYQAYGGDALGLVQVFDDGSRTYFQFRALDLAHVPEIWAERSDGEKRALPVEASSPYLVVHELAQKFVVASAAGKASVFMTNWHARGFKTQAPGELQAPAHAAGATPARTAGGPSHDSVGCDHLVALGRAKTIDVPFLSGSTEPTRQARNDLAAIAKRLARDGLLVIRARPSPGGGIVQARSRAASIKTLLLEAGVPASHMKMELSGTPKTGPVDGLFLSQIEYGAPSSGFVVLDGC